MYTPWRGFSLSKSCLMIESIEAYEIEIKLDLKGDGVVAISDLILLESFAEREEDERATSRERE